MNLTTVLEELRSQPIEQLADYLVRQRWFRSKSRQLRGLTVRDATLAMDRPPMLLTLIDCWYGDPLDQSPVARETYIVPLRLSEQVLVPNPAEDAEVVQAIAQAIRSNHAWPGAIGAFCGRATSVGAGLRTATPVQARPIGGEQSNTSYRVGGAILKLLRALEPGVSPEVEMLGHLTERGFAHAPKLLGSMEYRTEAMSALVAMLQEFIPNEGDGWRYTVGQLRGLIGGDLPPTLSRESARTLAQQRAPGFLAALEQLGRVTGRLHIALATDAVTEAFRPERIGQDDVVAWQGSMEARLTAVFRLVRQRADCRPAEVTLAVCDAIESGCRARIAALSLLHDAPVMKIRQHGDYHLGQVLQVSPDAGHFVIVDFEGEPARPLAERRQKACVLKDVAGMLRSFNYAREALAVETPLRPEQQAMLVAWEEWATEAFLNGYEETVRAGDEVGLLPRQAGFHRLLDAFQIDKAVYELGYELNNRPEWAAIPMRALQRMCLG